MEKATEEGAQKILDRIGVMRQRLGRVTRLRALKDRKEWKDLRDLLVDLKEQHDKSVEIIVKSRRDLDARERVATMDNHQDIAATFGYVLSLVERPQEEEDRLRNTIEDLEKSLAEKKAELETFK